MSNDSEIQRLRKIIEEKDNQISKLTSEIKSLKMFVDGKVKLGCEHYKTLNVFVKCQICNDFADCFQCHNKKIKQHAFKAANICKCRYCNKIYDNNLKCCPGCNVEKKLN